MGIHVDLLAVAKTVQMSFNFMEVTVNTTTSSPNTNESDSYSGSDDSEEEIEEIIFPEFYDEQNGFNLLILASFSIFILLLNVMLLYIMSFCVPDIFVLMHLKFQLTKKSKTSKLNKK